MSDKKSRKHTLIGFGSVLKQARASKDITQTELADKLGIKQATISFVESGADAIMEKRAAKWLTAMGYEDEWIWKVITGWKEKQANDDKA